MNIKLSDITLPLGYAPNEEVFSRTKSSIQQYGLLHDIIIQGDSPPYKIVSGRARFLAILQLNEQGARIPELEPGTIPCKIRPQDDKNPLEISLHENLRRNNLPWYEQVELEKELHLLRISQFGERDRRGGRPAPGEKKWSQNDTARELGLALGTFSQDMALARALENNPYLKEIKDKTTALKVVKQLAKIESDEIVQMIPSDVEMDVVLLGPSEVILKAIPDETFDVCITDPPWSEYKEESLRSDQEKLLPIFSEVFRVLNRNSFLFLITSTTDFYFYRKELPKIGFRVQSYPIIWHKTNTITYGRAPWQFARDYEPILVAAKGDPILTARTEVSSILTHTNVHASKLIHPNEKPIELMENILRLCSHPGAKIVDPFAGSGVTLEACKRNDRRYIGIEKEKEFYDKIVKRMNA